LARVRSEAIVETSKKDFEVLLTNSWRKKRLEKNAFSDFAPGKAGYYL